MTMNIESGSVFGLQNLNRLRVLQLALQYTYRSLAFQGVCYTTRENGMKAQFWFAILVYVFLAIFI